MLDQTGSLWNSSMLKLFTFILLLQQFLCWNDCFVFTSAPSSTGKRFLDDYIEHYHPLVYNHHELNRNHYRYKRSLNSHILLSFNAFNRDFTLKLEKDDTIFAPDHVHQNRNGTREPVDTSFVYKGTVLGYSNSKVFGVIIAKLFRGEISIPNEPTYHIEPSTRFFSTKQPFHSVIYSEKDLNVDPYKERREKEQKELKFNKNIGSCANDDVHEWMKSVQLSVIKQNDRHKRETTSHSEGRSRYTRSANQNGKSSVRNRTCTLFLQSDPQLWEYMTVTLKYNPTQARDEILGLFVNHVNAVKSIYEDTNFTTYDGSSYFLGVSFVVQRTTIMTPKTENCNSGTNPSQFCSPNIDVSNFLNQNSLTSHDDFCLAYIFTYRDFNGGTLGLAWVGSPNTAAGGICERFQPFPEGTKKVDKSLNTGVVTLVNFRQRVPPKVSQLTFAHEVGHNFGSPHDKSVECAPYGSEEKDANDGNYIMYASATSGDKKHNSMFSPCSKDNITRVLDAVINSKNGKKNCFVHSTAAFCGNKLVEGDEQCDCGYEEDCINNKCCHYRGSKEGKQCTLKAGANCSETSGPCCDGFKCGFITDKLCHKEEEQGCTYNSSCDGKRATCPTPSFKKNETLCNHNSKICLDGHCIGSVCRRIKWEECFLTPPQNDENFDRELLCYVSCTKTGKECISSKDRDKVKLPENIQFHNLLKEINQNIDYAPLKLPAGSPCDNFRGYCDVFHRCRRVDAEGPLARLKNLIFNPETLQTIREWIIVHWWAVMLMCIGLVLFMAAFIKVCAVHTPSSNPRKPAARKLSLPSSRLQNRPMSSRHHVPPPPYPGDNYSGPHIGHGRGPRYDSQDYKGPKSKGGARGKMEMRNFSRS
ncbi:and metalloproteinase domain-containing 10-like isoform X1 [Octopus vulgaris]|uniref:ADAM10 endopeptidase n=1 Tax=Octopus vulgaris TaxID=6645 RepID=A0AA36BL51_OCTVU|nr:and metalloproteinase domain-containing 10-like isoform X1 [Octopus vulgaris]